MRKIRFYILTLLLFSGLFVQAQAVVPTTQIDMADGMRSNGKIYVVVGVLLIILFGLFAYLLSIDRKIKRVEKSIEETKK